MVQSDRAGTVRQSWYSQTELVQSDRAGTVRQSWYSQTELVQSDRAGTLRQSWYSQTELVQSDRAGTVVGASYSSVGEITSYVRSVHVSVVTSHITGLTMRHSRILPIWFKNLVGDSH